MPSLTTEQIDTAKDAQALVHLLIDAGKDLPPRLRARILSFGPEVIPPLIELMQDEELSLDTAPGEGWGPIHAADLLGELHAEAAIQPMLRLLMGTDWDTYIHDRVLGALPKLGPAVLGPVLAARAATTDHELHVSLDGIMAALGVRDERIYNLLIEDLERDLEMGITPYHLAQYGDPRALPHLLAVLDRYESQGEGPLASFGLGDLVEAIERLGGQLTPEQQKKTDRILRQAYSQPQRAGQKIGRNEPCPCGSGKKHKKCCLGKERG